MELLWQARSATQAPEIDGFCYINDFGDAGQPTPGEMRLFRVTDAHDYDLIGELVDGPEMRSAVPFGVNLFPILASHPAQTYSAR